MPPVAEDLTDRQFGRLHVLGRDHERKGSHAYWRVECKCGNQGSVTSNALTSGATTSCGCAHREMLIARNGGISPDAPPRQPFSPKPRGAGKPPTRRRGSPGRARPARGGRFTPRGGLSVQYASTYQSWSNMIRRCTDPRCPRYPDWGGRGITVCDRWLDFANFLADMGERPPGRTLERTKNHLGYSPDNCVWATPAQQGRNTRRSKLDAVLVWRIRDLEEDGLGVQEIAAHVNLNRHTVGTVLTVFATLTSGNWQPEVPPGPVSPGHLDSRATVLARLWSPGDSEPD
jgi:hypothetical protein